MFDKLTNLFLHAEEKTLACAEPQLEHGFLRFPWPRQIRSVDGWSPAFHGTSADNAERIFLEGGLRPPGQAGVEVAHGQRGSADKRSMYVTPSRELAGHPVY